MQAEPRTSSFWHALLVGAITLAVFSPVVRHAFLLWDDDHFICRNPELAHPTVSGLAKFWTHIWSGYNQFTVPVTYTVWWVTARLQPSTGPSGGAPVLFPWTFHALNLVFHAAAAMLVFLILRRLVRSLWAAAAGAIVFALHPLQVEPVAWAANMYTSLSGALALGALLAWMSYADSRDAAMRGTKSGSRTGRFAVFAIGTLCFGLALLSKPSVVLLPLIAGTIDVLVRHRRVRDCATLMIWVLIGAADAVITSHVQTGVRAFHPPLWQRPLVAGDALAFYLGRVALPFGLVPDYSRTPQWVLAHRWVWATAMIPPALLAACFVLRRRAPWLLTGGVVFVLGSLPMLGLVPFDFQGFSTVGDRYVYLSLLGVAITVTLAVEWFSRRILSVFPPPVLRGRGREGACTSDVTSRKPPPCPSPGVPGAGESLARRDAVELIAVALILAMLIPLSRAQLAHWKDTRTLFAYTLDVNPQSDVAHLQLGYLLLTTGTTPAEWNEALAHYQTVAAGRPDDGHIQSDIGLVLLRLGRPGEAIAYFRRARQLDPADPMAAYLLGTASLAAHDRTGAIRAFTQAVHDFPNLTDAELRLADLLADAGNAPAAIGHYHAFLRLHPGSPEALAGLRKFDSRQQQAATDPQ
ncbi:MAG TPA: tetratricopeptide repeat protein [Tepidisphaeraceae bacterium]|nr:tetratricopeptide repeat protein [Tepidisphaeraceae bacterium]